MKINRSYFVLLMALSVLITTGFTGMVRAEPPVIVFAAASVKEALDEVAGKFKTRTNIEVSRSYGGSSALARQIQYGAPAQVFLSANEMWMDVLQGDDLLVSGTRLDLLENRLVLIAGVGTDFSLKIGPELDMLPVLTDGRLAMALVEAVPAGIYGRAALETLGVWEQVQGRVAQTDNVRAALRLVAVGEAPMGIVYATDAVVEPRVRVVGVFPAHSHPPIHYPVARIAPDDSPSAQAFFAYLTGPEARAVFQRHGFGTPGKGTR